MDPQRPLFRRIPQVLVVAGVALLLALFIWPRFMPSVGKHGRFVASTLTERWSYSQLLETYGHAWVSLQKKVHDLRHAEEENAKLRLENVHLKLGMEALQFDCNARSGTNSTRNFELKLSKETGTKAGRSLASLTYKPPARLLPSQLYTLGIAYLKAREDEKAAVIFTSLTGLEETDLYKTAKNLLITGVAWYRLENFILADHYFDEVLKKPEKEDAIQYQAQARLWKALIAKRTKKDVKTQYWLKELVDHHPYSTEASWINTKGGSP